MLKKKLKNSFEKNALEPLYPKYYGDDQ